MVREPIATAQSLVVGLFTLTLIVLNRGRSARLFVLTHRMVEERFGVTLTRFQQARATAIGLVLGIAAVVLLDRSVFG